MIYIEIDSPISESLLYYNVIKNCFDKLCDKERRDHNKLEDEKEDFVCVNSDKKRNYVLLPSIEKKYWLSFFSYYRNEIVLCDSKTGEEIKALKLEGICGDLDKKKLKSLLYSRNKDFAIMIFDTELIVYDLQLLRLVAVGKFEKTIKEVRFDFEEANIVVVFEKTVEVFEVPVKNMNIDEPERAKWLCRTDEKSSFGNKKEFTIRFRQGKMREIKVLSKIFMLS